MPKQMRRAALRSALSVKAAEAGIVVIDQLVLSEAKTRLMAKALNGLVGDATALILIPQKTNEYDMVVRSTNNLPDAKILMAGYLNIRDLLGFDKVVLPVDAIDVLTANLG
jgi:large subunit ribosomal protein L4